MSTEREIQFYAKISGAIQTLFDEDSDNQIDTDIFREEGALNEFFHCLATRVPQMVYVKITGNEVNPLEFNHLANTLIVMSAMEQAAAEEKQK